MAKYNLQPNEAIILKSKSVSHGFWGAYTDELMLTNLSFVWTSIGIAGFPQKVHQYPLNLIKVFEGSAQARMGEHSGNGSPMLEICFMNGTEESFGFQVGDKEAKREIVKWIKAINKAVTGNEISDDYENEFDGGNGGIPGTAFIAETLKGTIDTFKDAFGLKSKSQPKPATEKIAKKCAFCSAPLSGTKGQIVRCQYCDSDQQL